MRVCSGAVMLSPMSEVTRILNAVESGDPTAAAELLPLVYDELRKLAAARLAEEKPGQTLQPTALVHEAYVRLVGGSHSQDWNGRGHFFGAAAEAVGSPASMADRMWVTSDIVPSIRRRRRLRDQNPVTARHPPPDAYDCEGSKTESGRISGTLGAFLR